MYSVSGGPAVQRQFISPPVNISTDLDRIPRGAALEVDPSPFDQPSGARDRFQLLRSVTLLFAELYARPQSAPLTYGRFRASKAP